MAKLTIQTPSVFRPLFADGLRYLGAHGGRGSGKSHHFAERIVDEMVADPTLRVVCIREVQRSLRESAYRLIGDKISALRRGVSIRDKARPDRDGAGRPCNVRRHARPYFGVDKVFGINYLRMG
jgi:hypothetical protein